MLLSYLRDDCHKQAVTHIWESRWFESMYTLQRKNWLTRYVRLPRQSTYVRCTLLAGSPRTWQPFTQLSTDLNRSTAPVKKGSWHNLQHAGWPIRGSVPSFSPTTANKVVGKSQASIDNRLLGLSGLYHQHAIGTFNTCSRGPTHWCLTDSGEGYSLEGAIFSRTTPRPFQPAVFTFHLRASSGLQFNQVLPVKSKCGV
jgi:hypothetical protein